jgi:hypothetical protein
MAAEKRRQYGAVKGRIRALMLDGEWHGCAEIAGTCECSSSTATYHCQRLAESGHLETRPAAKGGHQYRLRGEAWTAGECDKSSAPAAQSQPEAEKCDIDHAPVPPSEPAPVAPPPERPADEEAAPAAPYTAWVGPPPFAGLTSSTITLAATPDDPEVRVLADLAAMDDEARERVLRFAVSKWWPVDVRGAGQ